MEEEDEQGKIAKGFDRDIDYEPMKDRLIAEYAKIFEAVTKLNMDEKSYISKRRLLIHKMMYLVIAMIQLKNASRIIEACKAFKLFLNVKDINETVIVKIAKSESIKANKKARFRKLKFPVTWIELKLKDDMIFYCKTILCKSFKQRVLDYLLKNFTCNTHSLRYACINYLISVRKLPLNEVAAYCGHSNIQQLIRYTQKKNVDKIFDID
jgi:integrase